MYSTPSLSPEGRVLLLSAGGLENDSALRALVEEGVAWPRLGTLAMRENALAVLMRRLDDAAPGAIPVEVRSEWEPVVRVSEFRLACLDQRLDAALTALRDAGVDVVLLKGAALARTVYSSIAERPMGDVDLLVPAADAERAYRVLCAARWKPEPDGDAGYERHHHLPPLVDEDGTGLALELHTELFPAGHPFPLTADRVRAEAEDAGPRTHGAAVPSLKHLALHLCLHFAWSHQMAVGGWRAFRDLATLAPTLEWDVLVDAARENRGGASCYWTLRLARAAAAVAVPGEVLAALRPALRDGTLDVLERHFLTQLLPSTHACPSVTLRRTMWSAAMQPGAAGHGRVRPWHFDPVPARPDAPRSLVPRHLRELGRWRRYAGALVGQPAAAAPRVPEARPGYGNGVLPPGFRRARLANAPTVSVVMASTDGGAGLGDALLRLVPQCRERGAELVVVLPKVWAGAEALRAEYPATRFVISAGARTAGELRAAGMAEASGDIITLTDETGALPAGWLESTALVHA